MAAPPDSHGVAFLSRQLSRLLADDDTERAFERLRDAAGEHRTRDVDYLERLLVSRTPQETGAGVAPYGALAGLLPASRDAQASFVERFVDYAQHNLAVYRTYWAGIAGQLTYLAALVVLVLLITGIFGFLVLPSFEQMFARMGSELPAFTGAVFGATTAGYPVLLIVAALVVGGAAWFAVILRRRVRSLDPLPRIPLRIPLAGKVADAWNLALFLNFSRMLLESGVPAGEALAAASRHANQVPPLDPDALRALDDTDAGNRTIAELAIAARLGQLDAEIASQCELHDAQLASTLATTRDRFSLGTSVVVGLLVAVVVIAMYLPIFRMGSVV